PQPEWKAPAHRNPYIPPLQMTQTEDALRITLSEAHRDPRGDRLHGDIYVPLPDLKRGEWGHVLVRARTLDDIRDLRLVFNLSDPTAPDADQQGMFESIGDNAPVIQDGSVQTYLLRAPAPALGEWADPWQELGLVVNAQKPGGIDLLSVSLIPKETMYADAPVGVRHVPRAVASRRTLYTHAPGRVEYRVRVPEDGRLDVGLGVLRDDVPVNFRITATPRGGEEEALFEETYADQEHWGQRSVDLSHLAGQTVTLALEAEADRAGTIALWAAPTLSGVRTTDKPNIIFYVIDGGGADLMSVYGYNRRTTPNLERLAAEGAVFEHAYSNSTWTKPSTASFMTSLQHSVLGGYKTGTDPLPEQAVTMAQHMHRAGYQTGVFVANPYAGRISSLDRGVDVLRDFEMENTSVSSLSLHEDFWRWREDYPAEPYWVHFQTTDVHGTNNPPAPFAGLYVSPEQRATLGEWGRRLVEAGGGPFPYSEAFEKTEIDRQGFFDVTRGLYDETMAHQDYQLGRFVERLKATGEWENTLLIVAADHGHIAGSYHFGVGLADPLPPPWEIAMASSHLSRIPLVIFWPARIRGGQRFDEPVSMIDMLPTILDLAGLPMPEVMQGQSLAPLLLGEEGWEPRPVILDEFTVDRETGELRGTIEVIDGRWAASLFIDPAPEKKRIPLRGHHDGVFLKEAAWKERPEDVAPLLLYDIWNDPFAFHSVHEERP
ncbi:MAG: sulfatase, partial [Acidimicrobiia bacterium]